MSLKLLLPPHPRMILLGMLPHKVVIYFSVPFIFPIQWVGVGAHHVAIYSAQHRVATEMGKAQFLPSRSSESSCRQTTQCFGISEVSWVAENQVNIFEEMFNRHRRMVADFQVEQGKKDPSSQERMKLAKVCQSENAPCAQGLDWVRQYLWRTYCVWGPVPSAERVAVNNADENPYQLGGTMGFR